MFVDMYDSIAKTSGRLQKISLLATFFKKIHGEGKNEWIYLLKGRVLPEYDSREFGISDQTIVKALSVAYGISTGEIAESYKKLGDLGAIAEKFSTKKRQSSLFSKKLTVEKVFDNFRKLVGLEGSGTVERRIDYIAELLNSATPIESKYLIRTILGDLRIGIAEGIIRDAIAAAFFSSEKKAEAAQSIEEAYDLSNDIAEVFNAASKGIEEIRKVKIMPGKPMKVMLALKTKTLKEAFEALGTPAAIEQKYDGFRMVISRSKNGTIKLFTRRLEDVTSQFPDVVSAVKKNVSGESFVLDSEVVGYNPRTKKYMPFEAISQRIKRKYEIERLVSELPVEINVFDVMYHNGKSTMDTAFRERRKIVERIVKTIPFIIRPAVQIITDSEDDGMKFYEEALKIGEEGVMVKKLDAPYRTGRRVGFMVKIKPDIKDLDLVIVGAEYGSGKRAGWLTSYIVACRDDSGFPEVGKVSSGLKEKEEEGTSYEEMTKLLKPLITEDKVDYVAVKPKIVVSVTYQNIQKSPSYSSGYAMRFPRITQYRPDRNVEDIASIEDIENAAEGK